MILANQQSVLFTLLSKLRSNLTGKQKGVWQLLRLSPDMVRLDAMAQLRAHTELSAPDRQQHSLLEVATRTLHRHAIICKAWT